MSQLTLRFQTVTLLVLPQGQEERTRLRVGSVSPILGMHGPHHCCTPYLAN